MERTRTASQAAFDVPAEGMLPVRVDDGSVLAPEKTRSRRSWLGIGVRIVRDAAVAVAFMTLVPIAMVAFKGDNTWGHGNFGSDIRAKLAQSRTYRQLALPKDPSITPLQAGQAFNALQPWHEDGRLRPLEPTSRPAHSWTTATLTTDMFVNGRMNVGWHGPSSAIILERVAKGFTPQEAAYLRTLATAPVWREFDLIARAPAVDIIGGSLKLPFPDNATEDLLPLDGNAIRGLAHASVSRAAYHMSVGQRDSAETALRSLISFGFVLIDNGHRAWDETMGNMAVAIGRDALARFYVITKDPLAKQPMLVPPAKVEPGSNDNRLSVDEMRQFLIAETQNPDEHLGMRFEAVRLLSAASCTNVKELIFGNGSDVTAALDKARTDLARYPSETALIDLLTRPEQPRLNQIMYNPIQALAVSSATVAGTVLRNPRFAACTRIVSGYYGGPW